MRRRGPSARTRPLPAAGPLRALPPSPSASRLQRCRATGLRPTISFHRRLGSPPCPLRLPAAAAGNKTSSSRAPSSSPLPHVGPPSRPRASTAPLSRPRCPSSRRAAPPSPPPRQTSPPSLPPSPPGSPVTLIASPLISLPCSLSRAAPQSSSPNWLDAPPVPIPFPRGLLTMRIAR